MTVEEKLELYKKAFCLFVNWAEENDIGYENIDGYKYQEELDNKGLGYIEGMMYIALKEAKNEHSELYDKWNKRCHEIMCYGHCSFNSPKHHRCGEWHREYNCALEGLKAGRPQWHKVADGDLPEKEDVFLIYTTKGFLLGHYEQGGADGKVDYCGEPYSDFTEYPSEEELVANEVIAWCEIPTFDKE